MSNCSIDVLYSHLREDLARYLSDEQSQSDTIWPDATVKQYASWALTRSVRKKFIDSTSTEADKLAFDKFLSANKRCSEFRVELATTWDEVLLGELKRALWEFFNPHGFPLVDSYESVIDRGRTGPGSSILARGADFYTKLFSSELSVTSPSLYLAYRNRIKTSQSWFDAENFRLEQYGASVTVEGSKLSFAPKTVDVSRMICVEPSLNMFMQLGLGAILEDQLGRHFGVDLSVQPDLNRELARVGSLEGSYSTIDLSSASDSISMAFCEQFLPRAFMSWVRLFRSRYLMNGVLPDRERKVELHCVSTMGNGFTFPLQTAIFSCIVSAASRARGVPLKRFPLGTTYAKLAQNYGVFGDDIICPTEVTPDVLRLLHLCGFVVNADKSFVEGHFRESCGRDYFHGHDVRGVYLKSLRTTQDRYVAINLLNLWTAKTGIYLPRTVKYLLKSTKYQPVPLADNEDAGIRVPFSMVDIVRRDSDTGGVIYRRSECNPSRIVIKEGEFILPAKEKSRLYNPNGLMQAFLRGDIRSGTISVRLDASRYRAKWGVTPFWDYVPFGLDSSVQCFWQRWKSAVYHNMM